MTLAATENSGKRRTKIVCTIGPSSRDEAVLRELMRAGMDVARLNFSHGDHASHRSNFEAIRRIAAEEGKDVAVLMDLQGPKIRTGRLDNGRPITLTPDASITVTTEEAVGNAGRISTTYREFSRDVKTGDRVLLADGTMELRVECVSGSEVTCTVVRGGELGEHKGMNLPGVAISAPSATRKDLEDLAFGLSLGVDYVALSFVRSAADLRAVRARMGAQPAARLIAKIERPEAVADFDAILGETDAVMVARGDLGVEMDLSDVPQLQKSLIRRCNERGVPVITATQMLESMVQQALPTRAEVADVANAIYDGTDAVMLSGETAAGRYPVKTVETMARVARAADNAQVWRHTGEEPPASTNGEAIGHAACHLAEALHISRIVCFTMSGFSALQIARFRPRTPITAVTVSEETRRRCALYWGVEAILAPQVTGMEEMVAMVDRLLIDNQLATPGDAIIIVAGSPLAVEGRTNLLKLHTIGDSA